MPHAGTFVIRREIEHLQFLGCMYTESSEGKLGGWRIPPPSKKPPNNQLSRYFGYIMKI